MSIHIQLKLLITIDLFLMRAIMAEMLWDLGGKEQ